MAYQGNYKQLENHLSSQKSYLSRLIELAQALTIYSSHAEVEEILVAVSKCKRQISLLEELIGS